MGVEVFDAVFFEQQEVKVPAAVFDGGGFLHGALADGAQRQAGRQGQGFLRGGEEYIQAPFVHGDFVAAER